MPPRPAPDFAAILRVLTRHRVDFIVVGGVAAVLHGAPLSTFDLDVVHSRGAENIHRLLAALRAMDAHYRIQPEKKLTPGVSHLASAGHQLLLTRFGPLDVLGSIGTGQQYEDLLPTTDEFPIAPGLRVRVLGLEKLIEVKTVTAGEKDRIALIMLRRTLEEKTRR